jgi:hypothetical protein
LAKRKAKDLTGKTFGKWTVNARAESYWNNASRWHCTCECGTKKIVFGAMLESGQSTSCGCANFYDLTGKKIGKRTVLSRAENINRGQTRWNYRCECGTESTATSQSLRESTSCGCDNWIDMTGEKWGRWTVDTRAPNNKGGQAMWHCTCDCGTKSIVAGGNLRNGISKSCGCAPMPNELDPLEAALRLVETGYKSAGKRRGYEWHLSREQFRALCEGDCFYCGEAPSTPVKLPQQRLPKGVKRPKGKRKTLALRNGVDRWDSHGSYTPDNTVSCCKECNLAKLKMGGDEYLAWMERGTRFRRPEAFACEAVLEVGNVEIEAARDDASPPTASQWPINRP